MKRITTLVICLLLTHYSFAANATDSANLVEETKPLTQQEIKSGINKTDSIETFTQQAVPGTTKTIMDFTNVDTAKVHSDSLYKHSLFTQKYSTWSHSDRWQFFSSLILLISFLVGGFFLAKNSSLCKDETYSEDGTLLGKSDSPYSYSRVQLFWWTMIILSTYIVFFGLTGYMLPLNATAVILLGLGIAVFAGGRLIDVREIKDNTIPLGSRTQDKKEQNSHFFIDILSDEKGISLHRFQAVVFNLTFGIGFLGYFFKSFSHHEYPFPDFSEGMFAMLGISASAYLGLKAAENKTANGATTPAPIKPIDGIVKLGEDAKLKLENEFKGYNALQNYNVDEAISVFSSSANPLLKDFASYLITNKNTLSDSSNTGVYQNTWNEAIVKFLTDNSSTIPVEVKTSLEKKVL